MPAAQSKNKASEKKNKPHERQTVKVPNMKTNTAYAGMPNPKSDKSRPPIRRSTFKEV
jgi:hypothetical protein